MFTFDFKAPRIDTQAYRRKVHEHLKVKIKEAARVWLQATVVSIIPVWSGASAATFLQLASEANFNLAIAPVVSSRVSMGQSQSSGQFTQSGHRFHFEYSTTLEHLIFNESHNANAVGFNLKRPGPYQFQQAGRAAFLKYAPTVKLPNPWDSRRVTRIRG